jgi:hypothetical protein
MAMRALRSGMLFALSVLGALGGGTAYASSTGPALVPAEGTLLVRDFDQQLGSMLTVLIASAEIGPEGKVHFNRALGDQRFFEPNSGRYWQISGEGQEPFASRSLWNRKLEISHRKARAEPLYYDSDQFPNEPLKVAEHTVRLPGSNVEWQFVVATRRRSR